MRDILVYLAGISEQTAKREGSALTKMPASVNGPKMTACGCRAAVNPSPRRARRVEANIEHTPLSLCRRKPRDQPPAKMSVWVDQKKRRRKPRHLPWTAYCGPTFLMTEPNHQALGSHDRPSDCDRASRRRNGRRWVWDVDAAGAAKDRFEPSPNLGSQTTWTNRGELPTMRNMCTSESEPPRRNAVWLGTKSRLTTRPAPPPLVEGPGTTLGACDRRLASTMGQTMAGPRNEKHTLGRRHYNDVVYLKHERARTDASRPLHEVPTPDP
ncbi:hypothetical protein B0T18DRAFT_74613 [Schizothecium vesticola]|uniref:Uncharacterized protein n=1 Tax=Schizothecium vesticola TaxID=314040 RepID=A0AA40F5R6_9PEZI|nr:hypothetical protein B0T18DRAFT_74613 [Schizothecium vesticola]